METVGLIRRTAKQKRERRRKDMALTRKQGVYVPDMEQISALEQTIRGVLDQGHTTRAGDVLIEVRLGDIMLLVRPSLVLMPERYVKKVSVSEPSVPSCAGQAFGGVRRQRRVGTRSSWDPHGSRAA